MEAIKQIMHTPKNHEIRITLPATMRENDLIEVIVLPVGLPQTEFEKNIHALQDAMQDEVFQQDLNVIARDFDVVDREGWDV